MTDEKVWALLMQPGTWPELILERPDWMASAACRGEPPATFFPHRGPVSDRAHQLCAACPVRSECADHAMADPQIVGIWGGLSDQQRRALRRDVA